MKQINSLRLPEHYVVIRNANDSNLYGIAYEGKSKQEVIVEPNYSCVTAFRALGRVFVAYFVDDERGWVIRNKKGDICSATPIIDFVACTKCLYGRVPTERGLELAVFDKELNIEKTFGVMVVDDYYTKNGVMVIPNDRKTLDVRDKRGQMCRINMCDNTLEDVISFGSEARVNGRDSIEDSDEYVENWQYTLNLTRGIIKKSDDYGNHASIVAELDKDWMESNIALFGVIFGSKPVHKSVTVKVKNHYEYEEHLVYIDIEPEKSKSIESLLRTIPSGEAPEYLVDLINYWECLSGIDIVEFMSKYFKDGFKAINKQYSVKVVTTANMFHVMVSDGRKVHVLSEELVIDLADGEVLKIVSSEVKEKELTGEQGRAIPKPKKHSGKRASYYKKVLDVKLNCATVDSEEEDVEVDVDFLMFTEFTYGPMVGEHKGRYNYTDKNIVLTTTTSDVYLVMD